MLLTTPTQNLTKARVDFKIDEFRRLVKQKGMRLDWEMTLPCPCSNKSSVDFGLDLSNVSDIDADSSGNNVSCPVCSGKGFVRHSKQEIQAIVFNANGEKTVEKHGVHHKSDIKITLEPEHLPSHGDRFIFKDSVIVWNETITMPVSDTITLSRPIVIRSLLLDSGATNIGILYVQKTDANGLGIDEEIPQTDLQINIDGSLTFLNAANRPLAGTKLSISYYTNPSYVVTGHPHTFRDTFLRVNNTEIFSPMMVQTECKLEVAN